MALINCSKCGKTVSDKANACPHCGEKMVSNSDDKCFSSAHHSENEEETNSWGRIGVIAGIVLAMLAAMGGAGWFWYDNEQKRIELEQMHEKARQDSIAQAMKLEQARLDSIKAAEEKVIAMQNAYKHVLKRFSTGEYFLYDITGDGVPELWLNVYEDDGSSWQIHQYLDNQMILIHHSVDGICYQGKNSIIIDYNSGYADDNSYSTYKVHYRDGKVIDDLINYESVSVYHNHIKPSEPKVKTYDIKNTKPIMETIK